MTLSLAKRAIGIEHYLTFLCNVIELSQVILGYIAISANWSFDSTSVISHYKIVLSTNRAYVTKKCSRNVRGILTKQTNQ
jgi:hypothetical protein